MLHRGTLCSSKPVTWLYITIHCKLSDKVMYIYIYTYVCVCVCVCTYYLSVADPSGRAV